MTRFVIDPGVLVSAFISPKKAAPALLVDAVLDGNLDALVCPTLIDELTDVLSRKKFAKHSADGRAAAFIAAFCDRARMVGEPPAGSVTTADADDDYLLALAQANDADAVVATLMCWTRSPANCRCSRRANWPTAWASRLPSDKRSYRCRARIS